MLKKVKNLDELCEVADFFLRSRKKSATKNQEKKATLVHLSGDLGSGKTAFVKKIAKIFKIKEDVISPTFVIEKRYKIKNKNFPWKNLIHIDAYRLEGKDFSFLNLEEEIKNPENIIFVEWAESMGKFFPKKTEKISFKFLDENTRQIKF